MSDDDGLYVTLEGIDGAGTSTVLEHLERDHEIIATWEPTRMWTGEVTREAFEERLDCEELTRFHLFQADRAEHHAKTITPALEDGQVVISDRGADSTRAYQRHTSPISVAYIEHTLAHFREPDLTIWFDIDVDAAMGRLHNQDDFEKEDLQRKANETYRDLYEELDRIKRVDASAPIETVVEDVRRTIAHRVAGGEIDVE